MGQYFLICVSREHSVTETSSLFPKKQRTNKEYVTCQSPYLFLTILASITSSSSKIYFEKSSSQSCFLVVTIYHLLSSYHGLVPGQILCMNGFI